jgi:hypothetical protein
VETVAAVPGEQVLGAVTGEQPTDNTAEQQQSDVL